MKKKRKKFWIIFITILIIALIPLVKYLLPEQIQRFVKNRVTVKVAARQAELNEAIAEMKTQDLPDAIVRIKSDGESYVELYEESYEELDNEKISEVFNELPVFRIDNRMNNSEGGYVIFIVSTSIIDVVPRNGFYIYGFYYSEEDKPLDIFSGDNIAGNTKVEVDMLFLNKYYYWTEKITDNWWYFDSYETTDRVAKR